MSQQNMVIERTAQNCGDNTQRLPSEGKHKVGATRGEYLTGTMCKIMCHQWQARVMIG